MTASQSRRRRGMPSRNVIEGCFQCDLDIGHVCYAGIPNARWGLHDGAVAALEAAQRHLNPPKPSKPPKKEPHMTVTKVTAGLRIPDGWTLEPLPRQDDHMLISTPPPILMTTVDFKLRGFRTGYSVTGRLVGEEWNKTRKKYVGRGWQQAIVDDAVAYLKEVMR